MSTRSDEQEQELQRLIREQEHDNKHNDPVTKRVTVGGKKITIKEITEYPGFDECEQPIRVNLADACETNIMPGQDTGDGNAITDAAIYLHQIGVHDTGLYETYILEGQKGLGRLAAERGCTTGHLYNEKVKMMRKVEDNKDGC